MEKPVDIAFRHWWDSRFAGSTFLPMMPPDVLESIKDSARSNFVSAYQIGWNDRAAFEEWCRKENAKKP